MFGRVQQNHYTKVNENGPVYGYMENANNHHPKHPNRYQRDQRQQCSVVYSSMPPQPSNVHYRPNRVVSRGPPLQRYNNFVQFPNRFARGKNCAVYDTEAPKGHRFVSNAPCDVKQEVADCHIVDPISTRIMNKLLVKHRFVSNAPCDVKQEVSDCQTDSISTKLMEIKLDKNKPSVVKLNEIMSLKKSFIDYDLISMEGTVHSPVFTVRAKCKDIITYGTGPNKKEAKKNAANSFLSIIDNNDGINEISSTTSNIDETDHTENILEVKSELNPIGVLQELCMSRRWELPIYSLTTNAQNTFSVKCFLKSYTTTGDGKTKQIAKKLAARSMYDKVKDLSEQEINVSSNHIRKTPNEFLKPAESDKIKLNLSKPMVELEKFYNELKSSDKLCINSLKNLKSFDELGKSAIDVLNELGKQEGFTVSYILISKTSPINVLVTVTINPIMIHLGVGKTVEEAQESGALAVLIYLKLMLEE